MFSVGENIVHPAHGAGTVVGVQEQELVEGYEKYFVIRFADKRLTVRVPQQRLDDAGLRPVMGKSKCTEVFDLLGDLPQQLPSDFKARRRAVEKLIQSGRPLKIAEAVRELAWRREVKRLNKADSELYAQARDLLIQEMALAMDMEQEAVNERIQQALERAVQAKTAALADEDPKKN